MNPRAEKLFHAARFAAHTKTDQNFGMLMLAQWIAAISFSIFVTPYSWAGRTPSIHIHVFIAVFFGGLITLPVLYLARFHAGQALTRHVIAASQMGWSALFIHLTGGRIETHFHVFVSLALLTFYVERSVLAVATATIIGDHLLRGVYWPQSVYDVSHPELWRTLEHAGWIAFDVLFLSVGIAASTQRDRESAERQSKMEDFASEVEQEVAQRTSELVESREQLRELLESTRAVPWKMSGGNRFTYVGPQASRLLGCDAKQWLFPGFLEQRLHPTDAARVIEELGMMRTNGGEQEIEFGLRREDGNFAWVRSVIVGAEGELRGFMLDVTEQQRMTRELSQSRHLESIGRLSAGIAHEINSPLQTMSDNLFWAREKLLDVHQKVPDALEIATALTDTSASLSRISEIVRSMRDFARPEREQTGWADLNHALAATLNVVVSTFDGAVDVQTRFAPLPLVACRLSLLNQAFLAVLENAGAAIRATGKRGILCVVTKPHPGGVEISISDTGVGMTDEVQRRVFDPFFTTREIGQGIGQGLTLARNAIVGAHGGSITLNSKPGAGTLVLIRLPVSGPATEVV